jgi:hypothetical protein
VLETLGLDYDLAIDDRKFKRTGPSPTIEQFKDFIYAYIKFGIPIILGIEFPDHENHSLTVVGFREPREKILLNKIATLHSPSTEQAIFKSHFINDCMCTMTN